jgi:spore coat polysaccharide biosynthesis protein SpsF
MKIGAIIQARMGSTRLPGKVLLPLVRGTVLSSVIERVKEVKQVQVIVIATTNLKEDLAILEEARKNGVEVFCGEPEDVLTRYVEAALNFNIDYIVRVTSDCPLLYYEGIDEMIEMHLREKADYSLNSNKSIKVYNTGLPDGTWAEVVTTKALLKADEDAKDREDREHVTLFLEANPARFRIKIFKAPPELWAPEMRLALDTKEDYILIKKIYDSLYEDAPIPTARVIKFLRERPELLAINSSISAKTVSRKIVKDK